MRPKERFGRYELQSLVAEGGMAQVYLARQLGPQGFVKPCVVKVISPKLRDDAAIRRLFLSEARVSALLNHANIVQTFDFGDIDGALFLAMELVDGASLAQLCSRLEELRRWIPLRASLEIGVALADALDYAHNLEHPDTHERLNLVHRDVSPQNILLSRQGGVKLSDFGIAFQGTTGVRTSRCGKPGYMAPEQRDGGVVSPRTDLFALGVVLVELVTGRRLITGDPTRDADLQARVRALFAAREGLPNDLLELALSVTAVDPEARPASGRILSRRLQSIASDLREATGLRFFLERMFERVLQRESSRFSPKRGTAGVEPRRVGGSVPEGMVVAIGEVTDVASAPIGEWMRGPSEELAGEILLMQEEDLGQGSPSSPVDVVLNPSSVDSMRRLGLDRPSTSVSPSDPSTSDPSASDPSLHGPSPFEPSTSDPSTPAPYPFGPSPFDPSAFERLFLRAPSDSTSLPEARPPSSLGWLSRARRRIHAGHTLIFVGLLLITALGLGVVLLGTRIFVREPEVAASRYGAVSVLSTPPGASVLVDGARLDLTTPARIEAVVFGAPISISVSRPGFVSDPASRSVVLTLEQPETSLSFELRRAIIFRIVTDPPGARVDVNGLVLEGMTPLTLPAMALGETATVGVSLEGHLPALTLLVASLDTSTTTALALEPASRVDVQSDPSGARVEIDGRFAGTTPLYDLSVPSVRPFSLEISKPGHVKARRRVRPRSMGSGILEVELDPLPLRKLPLSTVERAEAQRLERRLADLRARRGSMVLALKSARRRLDKLERSGTVFVGRLSDTQREVDDHEAAVLEVDGAIEDTKSELQNMREAVLLRLEE